MSIYNTGGKADIKCKRNYDVISELAFKSVCGLITEGMWLQLMQKIKFYQKIVIMFWMCNTFKKIF